jgi:hypothetical protein
MPVRPKRSLAKYFHGGDPSDVVECPGYRAANNGNQHRSVHNATMEALVRGSPVADTANGGGVLVPSVQSQLSAVRHSNGCLHCHTEDTSENNVQVRCDECGAYICDECHWCHEYQANHEIRVCDRCDGFYCKGCDEMDQCEDCGEVVCASCSTLLSCKFCGGGLCEECATACGRCGIVLCSRDAKFAVECDTCRLSYCLVCLASGVKDPCVRCGHRPSKRMEQLVHLRLKSIYKAFKQNSGSNGLEVRAPHTATKTYARLRENDEPCDNPDSLLQAAASVVAAKHPELLTAPEDVESQLVRLDLEQEKADAAAAALLAELEEEEHAEQVKKNKKKKRKGRNGNKKSEEEVDTKLPAKEDLLPQPSSPEPVSVATDLHVVATSPSIPNSPDPPKASAVDSMQQKLCDLVMNEDMKGLEDLMASLKGVPGQAALRKNAKKALKRLQTPEVDADIIEAREITTATLTTPLDEATVPDGAATPPPPTSDLLHVISYTHNKLPTQPSNVSHRARNASATPKTECVLHMASSIVGWVIGKGGQRIRDLMEESGARVWIDQENLGKMDPRIVYVSGHRKNVDSAVYLLQKLVAQTPTDPSASNQNTLLGLKSDSSLDPGIVPSRPSDSHEGTTSVRVQTYGVHADRASDTTGKGNHILTCDKRFVPLLIGRRGWTIKNIQDSSGARVDIDQNVAPPRITISGAEEQVSIAVEMVRDVLSYPHSQLQGRAGRDECDHAADHERNTPGVDHLADETLLPPNVSPVADRNRNSPPSSLIMPDDVQSTISASSSLSLTPEPSTASSNRTNLHVPSGPMLPPAYNAGLYTSGVNARSTSFQPGFNASNGPLFTGHSPSMILPAEQLFRVQSGQYAEFQQSTRDIGGASLFPDQNIGFAAPANVQPPNYLQSQSSSPFESNPLGSYGNIPSNQQQAGLFPLSQPVFSSRNERIIGQSTAVDALRSNSLDPKESASMWEQLGGAAVSQPAVASGGSAGFHLDAAVEFLQNSNLGPHYSPISSDADQNIGQSTGGSVNPQRFGPSARGKRTPAHGKAESQMVDSFFGPNKQDIRDNRVLNGLSGLSVADKDVSTGLWGVPIQALPSLGEVEGATINKSSALYAAIQPNLANTKEQRPEHSRFNWGP